MFDPKELEKCEQTLRQFAEYEWLWGSKEHWFSITDVEDGYQLHDTSIIRKWCENHEIPGAEIVSKRWRIPRTGLILFFGRRVMSSFLAA